MSQILLTPEESAAKRIARAALAYEKGRGGHAPKSVAVVMNESTLVITLHGALSAAEVAALKTPADGERLRAYHRQLFAASSAGLREDIHRITGVPVREAAVEIDTGTGAVVQAFTNGALVQVFLMQGEVPTDSWHEPGS